MNDQKPPIAALREATPEAKPKQEAVAKRIVDLLDDTNAIADWRRNIEKIRQKEAMAQTRRPS